VGLVAASRCADADEGHPVRAGNGLTGGLRVEAEEGADPRRHLLAFHAPDARARNDEVDLLMAGPGLVVLVPGRVRRDLEPVDPERLEAELATDETDSAARPGGLDLLDVDDAVPHQSLR
jgi:hypothetical protein